MLNIGVISLGIGKSHADGIVRSSKARLAALCDSGEEKLKMPAPGEALVSTGVCEALGISVGDTVMVRGTDMRELTVTVSGIYDNHVNNYVILRPETVGEQWGELPDYQMAFVTVKPGADIHTTGATISECAKMLMAAGAKEVYGVAVAATRQ